MNTHIADLIEPDVAQADFWADEAQAIYWHVPFHTTTKVIGNGPRRRWFIGGETNLCFNALDRHLPAKSDKTALIHCDYRGHQQHISYQSLYRDVVAMAWVLKQYGVKQGDRVMICLPMIPQAIMAMLACARLGAVHVVVYSGSTETAIAARLKSCKPAMVITFANERNAIKPPDILAACETSDYQPKTILQVDSDDYALMHQRWLDTPLPCVWLAANATSHLLYTSGTTGQPKGIERDTGGYAVALMATMKHLFAIDDNEVFFTTADIGWVTGHSYLVYAPLLAGITTVMVEPSPYNNNGRRWWQWVEKLGITRMLTIAGNMRLARRSGAVEADLGTLRGIYLAGEPLDAPTYQWVTEATQVKVEDHYWQTETGWPILAGKQGALQPILGREIDVIDADTGLPCPANCPGMLVIKNSLGPGGMKTLWQNDADHDQRYWFTDAYAWHYRTYDWAVKNSRGELTILGRADDVINIGGKRLSTGEVERTIMTIDDIHEVAAVGIPHALLGQMVGVYIVARGTIETCDLRLRIKQHLIRHCGRHAMPRRIYFVEHLPKTFSGKIIRRELYQQDILSSAQATGLVLQPQPG